MEDYGIRILCLQKTWRTKAADYCENGYRFIRSGEDTAQKSHTGVGFIISSKCSHLLRRILQYSGRLASIKLEDVGGFIAFVTAYAPHNLYPHDTRQNFYELGVGLRPRFCT